FGRSSDVEESGEEAEAEDRERDRGGDQARPDVALRELAIHGSLSIRERGRGPYRRRAGRGRRASRGARAEPPGARGAPRALRRGRGGSRRGRGRPRGRGGRRGPWPPAAP